MAPDPTKVQDILNLKPPTSVTEVRSLLGMTNYCARFIEGYATCTLTEPLRAITHKNHNWEWIAKQDHALAQRKHVLDPTTVIILTLQYEIFISFPLR